jgi:hypothetical protein
MEDGSITEKDLMYLAAIRAAVITIVTCLSPDEAGHEPGELFDHLMEEQLSGAEPVPESVP